MKRKAESILFCVGIILLCFVLCSPLVAGELYLWVDEKGVSHITDRPPEKPAKMIGKETFKRDSPDEIQRYQAGEKAKEQKREAELRQRQQANRAQEEASRRASEARQTQYESQRSLQRSRDQRADKVESDTRERLRAVSGMGFNLPSENRNAIEKAAASKADQIRKGTDTPMTASEDAEFHRRQDIDSALQWHKLQNH